MTTPYLKRELGLWGAVGMGLGSILGTGVFVSIGTAAEIAGSGVLLSILIGGIVATCNGLNAAQLAASHPVSGGTYEYGYRYLNPLLGFAAGWLFLLAKSASAATAALGCGGYLAGIVGLPQYATAFAIGVVLLVTGITLAGIKRSNWANAAIVSVTIAALVGFVVIGCIYYLGNQDRSFSEDTTSWEGILHSSALMFVAYTGYGRIATLGEEVLEPQTTIPKAIGITLILSMVLYLAVGGVGTVTGIATVSNKNAPLLELMRLYAIPGGVYFLSLGAITATLGVLLNLTIGLSRIILAMGRRGDLPKLFAQLSQEGTTPTAAVLFVSLTIGALVLLGNVKTTWSFSAFNVLLYYAITNAAALRLSPDQRLFSPWLAAIGFASCGFLAFWVEGPVWVTGCVLLLMGAIGRSIYRRFSQPLV